MEYNIVETIGWLGTAVLLFSMTQSNMTKLRVINSVGTLVMIAYTALIGSLPMLVFNLCMLIINGYHIMKIAHKRKAIEQVNENHSLELQETR